MSQYRYFELSGESLKSFVGAEKLGYEHSGMVQKSMDEHGIEEWSGHPSTGNILAFKFKNDVPDGFIAFKWRNTVQKGYYVPHRTKKICAEWRDLMESCNRPQDADAQVVIVKLLDLPMFVNTGESNPHGHGIICRNSVVGHVGEKVFVRVPSQAEDFTPHSDMKEIKEWEFLKYQDEAPEFTEYGYTI